MINFNLCCISNELAEKGIRFQTITYKRFNQLGRIQGLQVLSEKILNNVRVTHKIIEHCFKNQWGYRVSSSLFPLITYSKANVNMVELKDYNQIIDSLAKSAEFIVKNPLRISSHPGEFTSIDSDNDELTNRSIVDLESHGWLHDQLGLSQDYSNPINIHLKNNKSTFDIAKSNTSKAFAKMSASVRNRIVFENNHNGRWNTETLLQHYKNILPITFDNLHDTVNPSRTQKQNFIECVATWTKFKPLFHYSEGNDKNKRSHRDLPVSNPVNYEFDVDYDVELKGKDAAIRLLTEKMYRT